MTETAQAALKKLLASPHFSNSRRLSEFLRFIAEKAIAGQTADIGERLIASEIYGRGPDYDPAVDSIVRVEANRLRAKLREYYEGEGCDDPIRVRLPLDSYAPVFEAVPAPVPSELTAATGTPWRIALVVALAAAAATGALVPLSRRAADSRSSIAVLPFANTGGLAEKDYFSDGLTEQIADHLARSGKLQVAARGSAQRFRKPGEDVRRIGQQLHVALVLEGGVRFSGDGIEVSTRLFDTRTGRQLWSREFSGAAAEAPVLQNEISTALASALRLGNAGGAREADAQGWTHDSGALDLYLQARYLFNSRRPESLWKSVHLFDAALKRVRSSHPRMPAWPRPMWCWPRTKIRISPK